MTFCSGFIPIHKDVLCDISGKCKRFLLSLSLYNSTWLGIDSKAIAFYVYTRRFIQILSLKVNTVDQLSSAKNY
jgi:hypothetical protein